MDGKEEIEKEEQREAKSSDPAMDAAQRAAKEKELASLRRQRGCKRAAVTRITKVVEEEISRQASYSSAQEVYLRLREAFTELRKAHQLYESLVEDEELEETQEYAGRLEEEECSIRRKVDVYLKQLDEARSSTAPSSRSRKSRSRHMSRTSAMTTGSTKSKEAEVELDDADSKLRDIKAQLEEERQTKLARRKMEERRRQEEWELEERERALKIKVLYCIVFILSPTGYAPIYR